MTTMLAFVLLICFAVRSTNAGPLEKARAIKAFRHHNSSKSDAEMDEHLEKVKAVLKKRNDKAKLEHLNSGNTTKKEVKRSPKHDAIEGTPKRIDQLNLAYLEFLLEGDIALTPAHVAALDISSTGHRQKRAAAGNIPLWPTAAQGVIAYKLDSSLTPAKIAVITAALQFWESNTCLNFENTAASTNGLNFVSESGCWSYIGMIGGFQTISIGDGCEYLGIVTHEIGHALGFYHEQSRWDRDSYVQINYQYIQPTQAHNFVKAQITDLTPFTSPYDYGSVMHYSSDSFTYNESFPTITAADSTYEQAMGQRKGPSFYDVRAMNYLYKCNATCAASNTVCLNGGYPDPLVCTNCKCPSGFAGQFCAELQSAENTVCGGVLMATTSLQTFTTLVGTTDLTDAAQSCYWQIASAPGTAVEVTVTAIGGACSAGCFWDFLELKMGHPTGLINGINVQSPFEGTGYRFCCATDHLNVPYVSSTNLVPIIAYGNFQLQFTIQYRQVPTISAAAFITAPVPIN